MAIDLDLKVEMGTRVGLAYAICRKENDAKQTASRIFRALCRDVAGQLPEVDSELRSMYRSSTLQGELAIRDVRKIFSSVISTLSTTFLVVDALDECQDVEQRIRLVKELLALIRDQTTGVVKILVSSRHDALLEDLLGQYKQLDPKEHNSEDLKAYIDYRLAGHSEDEGKNRVKNDIRQACIDKANGMFLWVKWVASSLDAKSLSDLQILRRIKAVPSGLRSIYDSMLDSIWSQDEDQRADALLVLLWVLHATVPLMGVELLDAVIDYSDLSSLDEAKSSRQPSASKLVLKCANMVYIDSEGYVRFSHSSLLEYFKDPHPNPPESLLRFKRLEETVHERLAGICVKFMLLRDFDCGPAKTEKALVELAVEAPFLGYAGKYWGWHVAQHSCDDINRHVRTLIRSTSRRELSMQVHLYRGSEDISHWLSVKRSNPLHILSVFGLKDIAVGLPNVASMAMSRDASGRTPLDYALLGNHAEMCLWLMQTDQTPHHVQLEPQMRLEALHRGAAKGWTQLLKHLLAHDQTDVDLKLSASSDPRTPLVRACLAGQTGAVELLIKHGADVNLKDGYGLSPLIVSITNRYADITNLLLDHGAEVKCCDTTGLNPLHIATSNRDSEVALLLIAKQTDLITLHTPDKRLTPVHYAAGFGEVDILRAMYEYQPDLTTTTIAGSTPLHIAARNGMHGAVNALIDFEVPKDERNDNGETALFVAALDEHWRVVESLLQYGCSIDIEDNLGQTVMHAAASGGSEKVLRCLVDHAPSDSWVRILNKPNISGEAPLHIAIKEGNSKFAAALLARGANASLPGYSDAAPIHYVARHGPATLVSTILRYTENVNARDKTGDTPLHYAARASNVGFIRELLSVCSRHSIVLDCQAVNHGGTTPLLIALGNGCQPIAEILVEHDQASVADSNGDYPIHLAAWYGYDSIVQRLLDRPGCAKQGYGGWTPLACAALRGHLTTVQLLEAVSREVLDVPDDTKATPLMLALRDQHLQVADFLIAAGAKLDTTDKCGWTLLHTAADIGDLPMIQRLLGLGCDVDARTVYGESVFHRAVWSGNIDIVDELLRRQVNHAKIPNAIGQYCTHLASSNGDLKMLQKLDELEVQYQTPCFAGRNAAAAAAASGHWELLQFLRDRGEDLEFKDTDGYTPIRFAALQGYPSTVNFLLQLRRDEDLNSRSDVLASALLGAMRQCRPDSVSILLGAGADPTRVDEVGLNGLDYASQYLPLQRQMLRSGHLDNPNTRQTQGRVLAETIRACCEVLVSATHTESISATSARTERLIELFEALRRVQDHKNAATCAMELLWRSDPPMPGADYACGLCGGQNFEGDKYSCKACYFDTMLCSRCHEDYVEAGCGPPPAFVGISALEEMLTPVRTAIDGGYSLLSVWSAMEYFVDGSLWMSKAIERYEQWEQRWNSGQRYWKLERPGQDLLKMAKEAGQYWMKAESGGIDPEVQANFSKLSAKFRRFRKDKEFVHFPCKNHEYFAIKEADRVAALRAGKYINAETGRVNKTWAQEVLVKYSAHLTSGKILDGDIDDRQFAATDNPVDAGEESVVVGLKRALTGVGRPPAREGNDDLLSGLIGQNTVLVSNNAAGGEDAVKQLRRAATLPLETPSIGHGRRGELKIEVKDASVIAGGTGAPRTQASGEASAVVSGPSANRTLSVLVVTEKADPEHSTDRLAGGSSGNHEEAAASRAAVAGVLAGTLVTEPESVVGREAGRTADGADTAGPQHGPVAVITAVNGDTRTEGNDGGGGMAGDRALEIAYEMLYSDPGTQRDLDLWKLAVTVTQAMNPDFIAKLCRVLRYSAERSP